MYKPLAMIIKQFPDINWLRRQAQTNFADKRVLGNQKLPKAGWPNVVLNTKCQGTERSDIVSPLSVFLNISGKSFVKVEGKQVLLAEDNYCIVNPGETYNLIIPEGQTTETFNLHIGEAIQQEITTYLNSTRLHLLNEPFNLSQQPQALPLKSNWKKQVIRKQLNKLKIHYAQQHEAGLNDDIEYELLSELVLLVTKGDTDNHLYESRLEALKRSTRLELINRIQTAIDFIQVYYKESISLDDLSQVACLSKYHFLRTFKEVCQCTPSQYIAGLRFNKAWELLHHTDEPMTQIATDLGFSETAAFSRFFRKMAGFPPNHLRKPN